MKRIADFKEKNKDELMDLTPDAEKEALTTSNVVNVLKERDHKGRRVLIVNSGSKKTFYFNFIVMYSKNLL